MMTRQDTGMDIAITGGHHQINTHIYQCVILLYSISSNLVFPQGAVVMLLINLHVLINNVCCLGFREILVMLD